MKKTDTDTYDLTSNLERWTLDDLIRYATDTTVMMSLDKHQIVHIAQELAYRLDELVPE